MKILKFYEWVRCNLIGWLNLTSWLWLVGGQARIYLTWGVLAARMVYSLWGRVEKMLFRPIRKKQNSLSFNKRLHREQITWSGLELTTLVVMGPDCIGSYKSNYYTIMTIPLSYEGFQHYDQLKHWFFYSER